MKKKNILKIITLIIILTTIICVVSIKNKTKNVTQNEVVIGDEGIFLLYIDEIIEENENLKIVGIISNGSLKVNDEISILGLGKKGAYSKVIKIEVDNNETNMAKAGEKIKITLESSIKKEYIEKGQSVILSGTTKPIYNIDIKVTSTDLNISEIKDKGNIFYINSDIGCSIKIISEEKNTIKATLDVPIVVEKGLEIIIKNDTTVIANGIVE